MRNQHLPDNPFDPTCLDDEYLPESVFGQLGGTSDWPDPRILNQNNYWCGPEGVLTHLDTMEPEALQLLLKLIIQDVEYWHSTAADLEMATMPTAMLWACEELNVPLIAQMPPDVWLESTELYLEIEKRISDAA